MHHLKRGESGDPLPSSRLKTDLVNMSLATFFGQMFANLKTLCMVAFVNKVFELKGRYQNEKRGNMFSF